MRAVGSLISLDYAAAVMPHLGDMLRRFTGYGSQHAYHLCLAGTLYFQLTYERPHVRRSEFKYLMSYAVHFIKTAIRRGCGSK